MAPRRPWRGSRRRPRWRGRPWRGSRRRRRWPGRPWRGSRRRPRSPGRPWRGSPPPPRWPRRPWRGSRPHRRRPRPPGRRCPRRGPARLRPGRPRETVEHSPSGPGPRDPGDQRERLGDAVPHVSHRGEDVGGTGHRRQSHRRTLRNGPVPHYPVASGRVGPLPRVGGISGPSPVSWETSALCERPGAGTRARPTTRRCRHRWGISRRGTARVAAASPGAAAAG